MLRRIRTVVHVFNSSIEHEIKLQLLKLLHLVKLCMVTSYPGNGKNVVRSFRQFIARD